MLVANDQQETGMASVHDVAAYILERTGTIDTMALQKLLYYSEAYSLAWDNASLFDDAFEAWANGPVVRAIFSRHKGMYKVSSWQRYGKSENLEPDQRETVDAVLDAYGHLNGTQLSVLTHREDPWREARAGLPDGAQSRAKIDKDRMREYYSAQLAAHAPA
jgi:uncharacterized phage-associated protein